jgi:hypothetical protein
MAALLLAAMVAPVDASRGWPRASAAANYNLLSGPHAGFVWFPAFPRPGEPVLLASVSTDRASPITGFAWDLGQGAGLRTGGPTLDTTFSTFAPRTVRLRVTNRSGVSDIATETIHMSTPPASVIQPFPIVRIVGTVTGAGIRLRSLAVAASAGDTSSVRCVGRPCPVRALRRAAPAAARGLVWLRFHRLERFLPAGVALQIRVSAPGKVGSYTRYKVRRHRLPLRVDTCLDPAGVNPITCPTS